MTTLHTLHLITDLAAKAFAFGGELFSITAILWCLRLTSGLIETSYKAGVIAGRFYKLHLHKWTIRAIAFYWLGCVLTFQGLRWIYEHRAEILATINSYRHKLGDLFAYRSPVFAS